MRYAEVLASILAEGVPEHVEQAVEVPEPADEPRPVVTVSAVGGEAVEVDQFDLKLAAIQAGVAGPDLDHDASYGRLLDVVRANGPAKLFKALLSVRAVSLPIYRLRQHGRPWKPNPITIKQENCTP